MRHLPLITHGTSSGKWDILVSIGFMFLSGLLCCTHSGNEVSLVIPAGMQGYRYTCSSISMMPLMVGILASIAGLVPCPNDTGGEDFMLMLNKTVNSAWFSKGAKIITVAP